ncbi:hypothetical protein CHLNCDRAFT_139443, partial [Chlorella variabilis]
AFSPPEACAADLATLVYTSGTTGHPKGVMLTHANLLYQAHNLSFFLPVSPGQRTLSLLPPWHIYERACGYYLFSRGAAQVYSNIRKFREDLTAHPPDYFVCVPLVLDTLHGKGESGPSIGLPILNGWGLTETSPVLACRRNLPLENVRGSVGQPTPGTQLRLVDPESLQEVADGQQGLLLARGPGVMAGYYADPGATAKAFKAGDGWFDTGDLG